MGKTESFTPYLCEFRRMENELRRLAERIENPQAQDRFRELVGSLANDSYNNSHLFTPSEGSFKTTLGYLKELEQEAGQPLLLRLAYERFEELLPETVQAAFQDLREKLPDYDLKKLEAYFANADQNLDAVINYQKPTIPPEVAQEIKEILDQEGLGGEIRYGITAALLDGRHYGHFPENPQEILFHEEPYIRAYVKKLEPELVQAFYEVGHERNPRVLVEWELHAQRSYDYENPPRLTHDLPLERVSDRLMEAAREVASGYGHMWSWDEMYQALLEAKEKGWGLKNYEIEADRLYYKDKDASLYTGALGPGLTPNFWEDEKGRVHYSHTTGTGRTSIEITETGERLEYRIEIHRPGRDRILSVEPNLDGHRVLVHHPAEVHSRHIGAAMEVVERATHMQGREAVLEGLKELELLGRANDFLKEERAVPEWDQLPVDLRETYRNLKAMEGGPYERNLYVDFLRGLDGPCVQARLVDYMGYENILRIYPDGAELVSTWGGGSYWDRWSVSADGGIVYTGTVPDGENRVPPPWVELSEPGSEKRHMALIDRVVERIYERSEEARAYDLRATAQGLLEEGYQPRAEVDSQHISLRFESAAGSRSIVLEWDRVHFEEDGRRTYEPAWLKGAPEMEMDR